MKFRFLSKRCRDAFCCLFSAGIPFYFHTCSYEVMKAGKSKSKWIQTYEIVPNAPYEVGKGRAGDKQKNSSPKASSAVAMITCCIKDDKGSTTKHVVNGEGRLKAMVGWGRLFRLPRSQYVPAPSIPIHVGPQWQSAIADFHYSIDLILKLIVNFDHKPNCLQLV